VFDNVSRQARHKFTRRAELPSFDAVWHNEYNRNTARTKNKIDFRNFVFEKQDETLVARANFFFFNETIFRLSGQVRRTLH